MTARPAERDSSAYTVDLAYPSAFMIGQTPLAMQWTAARAGASPGPLTGSFDYCDLGCGAGSAVNLLAACYPQGRFVGIDINAEHIAKGRAQAARAGLDNVSLYQASFAGLASLDLPDFDYVTAVGIYSWVPPELQRAINAFARGRLKAGGLLGLHYSSLPGSAVRDPVCNYLQWLAETQSGNSAERLMAAIGKTQKLARFARFFEQNERAGPMLSAFARSTGTAVHDVLNCEPHSFYFRDVLEHVSEFGFEYLGSANTLPDYPELILSREAYAVVESVSASADLPFREATRDIVTNAGQRFDVFRVPLEVGPEGSTDGIGALGELHLQRTGTKRDIERRQQHAQSSPANLTAPVYTAVLDIAEGSSITIRDALASDALAGFGATDIRRAIEHLFALGFLNVLVRPSRRASDSGASRFRLSSALNADLLKETIASPRPLWLASQVLGSPIRIPTGDRLMLLALVDGDLEQAWRKLSETDANIAGSGGRLPPRDFAQFRAEIEQGLPRFRQDTLPYLLHLDLVEQST